MALAKLALAYDGHIFSPFSGKRANAEQGPRTTDRTLMFVYYGDAGEYAYMSKACIRAAKKAGITEPEGVAPETLMRKLTTPCGVVFVVDCGWNGINYYGFAPVKTTVEKTNR